MCQVKTDAQLEAECLEAETRERQAEEMRLEAKLGPPPPAPGVLRRVSRRAAQRARTRALHAKRELKSS